MSIIIHQWSLPSGGKLRWDAGEVESNVISLEGDKCYHITEVRCALDFEEDKQSRVGVLQIVRNDDRRSASFVREQRDPISGEVVVDAPLLRYGYRRLDWDTKEEVIVGDLSLFEDDWGAHR